MKFVQALERARDETMRSLALVLGDVGRGMLALAHSSLALVGLAVVAAALFVGGRGDLRARVETVTLDWLQTRQVERTLSAGDLLAVAAGVDAVGRATAADPGKLTRAQASVAQWISRRYRVAPEPVARLVQEAWLVGQQARLDPTLILAIMAVESSFNPFAQSSVGAQGLMQVMTHVHSDKYQPFGGEHAAFDPVTNLRVGVQVLKDCIARAGSIEAGLRYYVGAALLDSDGGYAAKVLWEQSHLQRVAGGQQVATNVTGTPPAPVVEEAAVDARAPKSGPAGAMQQVAVL